MAYTVTRTVYGAGNLKTTLLKIEADAATQTVETGLQNIVHMSVAYQSMTTVVGPKIVANSNASGVQSLGVLGISGCASGDLFYVTVYGR